MKGIISALSLSNDGILAAGTFSRSVGLYDSHGLGSTISVFSLHHAPPSKKEEGQIGKSKGKGITQLLWSSCSRYLCIAERSSDGIGVWDIRGTGQRLAWLEGRKADTQQRLGFDLMGEEVWAGGTDGMVRVWEGLGMKEGMVEASWGFRAHDDVVSSTGLHPTGSVLATCSGQRHWDLADDDDADDADDNEATLSMSNPLPSGKSATTTGPARVFDNSLKIWAA